ncbi:MULTISPECIES: helix-turn-helix domain-containing protein [Butyricimonas]|uniref:helix-turn-helix domain-containing protein n=1 Tax=Butyricimonas TaxID=574697 RepID=UPI001D06049E|nr:MULTISPECIES: helix-turn-helix transcriptional regulator [Butyricimonas]MCB6971516.1 helix-turn-helix transcriptional regulator [Butyricimonas synergistica]MCG4518230.1 helix-turn-helix transcriptional regulator [Butyricimonas sp. DFI.6.44]
MKKRRDEILLKEIARRIKELRDKKGISQIDFLIATDINVSRIELAKFNITVSTLKAICDYFEISLSDFLKDIPISEFSNE